MKDNHSKRGARLSPAIVEDKATEKLKKRLEDLGLIVNVGKPAKSRGKKKGSRHSS